MGYVRDLAYVYVLSITDEVVSYDSRWQSDISLVLLLLDNF